MDLIKVDKSLCTKCGACIKVCPTTALCMKEDGPEHNNLNSCIACGQCAAVCPCGALDNVKTPLCNQTEIKDFKVLDPKLAEYFLRSRRSIRCYKNTHVPYEELLKLVNIAHFAPTASNSQGVSYIIVRDKKILEKSTEIIVKWMEDNIELHWSFPRHINNYRKNGIDSILRDAPHIILATALRDFRNGRENTISALSYIELFAPTLGLGSCWAGLFEFCAFSNYGPLLDLFNIPKDKVITGALMVGYPKYKYKRLVDRNPLDVTCIG
ncbi:nitroreductase family protein [Clostridium magnum]|uniref:Ferredoxin n=1 Tax=Clostridium magnum DSM 2767 TaxID=1121326 RepID=A0A162R5R5_9CLOT|nr:nitroreductase family protein [Clostridium magnum]KZL89470.1 ferredoxin [Clostridium magnum DSM 2767]SHJ30278.1 Nitroreductase [Clostridium magnum DSM 2767]